MSTCNACPRKCNVQRKKSKTDTGGQLGFCGMASAPTVALAALHIWEEPCISGANGSGTVFFSGCSLRCCFCQNHEISTGGFGEEITIPRLRQIYHELILQGAHNINLVNPTHFASAIAESLDPPLPVPVVYNSSGFESLETLRLLRGKIQVYLPDFKYSSNNTAQKYSSANGYFDIASAAIKEMFLQTGSYSMGGDGTLQNGVLIRHLILPSNIENTLDIIDWVSENFNEGEVLFSLMRQYTPCGNAALHPEINRKLTPEEYKRAEDYLLFSGIADGFLQAADAASNEFIPKFDGLGVL